MRTLMMMTLLAVVTLGVVGCGEDGVARPDEEMDRLEDEEWYDYGNEDDPPMEEDEDEGERDETFEFDTPGGGTVVVTVDRSADPLDPSGTIVIIDVIGDVLSPMDGWNDTSQPPTTTTSSTPSSPSTSSTT